VNSPEHKLQSATPKRNPPERILVVLCAVGLLLRFLFALQPADEVTSSALTTLTILIELGMMIGVIGLGVRVLQSQTRGRAGWAIVLAIGVAAGLGLFVIRINGGPRVVLPARNTAFAPQLDDAAKEQMQSLHKTQASNPAPGVNFMKLRLALPISACKDALAQVKQTKWRQAKAGTLRQSIVRQDIVDFNKKADAVIGSLDGLINEMNSTRDVPASERECCRLLREMYVLSRRQGQLFLDHYNEWKSNGLKPNAGEMKPWEKALEDLAAQVQVLASRQDCDHAEFLD
jgi:hypothetical protein